MREFERLPAGRDLAGELAQRLKGRAGFEDAHVSVRTHGKLAGKLAEGVELVPAGDAVEGCAQVKDRARAGAHRRGRAAGHGGARARAGARRWPAAPSARWR